MAIFKFDGKRFRLIDFPIGAATLRNSAARIGDNWPKA
jgi:hypothetical protein